ncbi:MAG: hypothetical protein U0835_03795 [Isosphaeraceae bacterium]
MGRADSGARATSRGASPPSSSVPSAAGWSSTSSTRHAPERAWAVFTSAASISSGCREEATRSVNSWSRRDAANEVSRSCASPAAARSASAASNQYRLSDPRRRPGGDAGSGTSSPPDPDGGDELARGGGGGALVGGGAD